jgi:histidinol phosphatase-like PHP family hydrolase
MARRKVLDELADEEAGLRSHWYDILKYVKKDLAYVWDDKVKSDFEAIKIELERIMHILRELSSHYKSTDNEAYAQEIKEIDRLMDYLKEVQASKEWVRGAHKSLQRVIGYIEKNKKNIRQYQGDLHIHSQDSSEGVPISGSNCGGLPVVEIIRYAGTRMGQKFIAMTDHSRDADVKSALEYWGPKGKPEVAEYGDGRVLSVYQRIDAIKNPSLKVFKGIEVNLLPDGEFDSKLPSSSEVKCVNCSIHPNLDREGFAEIKHDPKLYTELVLKGIQNPHTNIMCHIGYGCDPGLIDALDWGRICSEAISNRVAIEINVLPLVKKLIFDEILDFGKFKANSTDYRDYLRGKLSEESSTYIGLLGDSQIRQMMTPYFPNGLRIAINTDQHWSPFIGGEDAKRYGWFRKFSNLSSRNSDFRIKRIRFFVCLKIVEKEFQGIFSEVGITSENIINSYPPKKLATFLEKAA